MLLKVIEYKQMLSISPAGKKKPECHYYAVKTRIRIYEFIRILLPVYVRDINKYACTKMQLFTVCSDYDTLHFEASSGIIIGKE